MKWTSSDNIILSLASLWLPAYSVALNLWVNPVCSPLGTTPQAMALRLTWSARAEYRMAIFSSRQNLLSLTPNKVEPSVTELPRSQFQADTMISFLMFPPSYPHFPFDNDVWDTPRSETLLCALFLKKKWLWFKKHEARNLITWTGRQVLCIYHLPSTVTTRRVVIVSFAYLQHIRCHHWGSFCIFQAAYILT